MIFDREDKFILIKIFKNYLKDFDIYDKEQIIELFKDIFVVIKSKYNLSGLFDVDIYVNDSYGLIIEINNLYFGEDESDLKISIHLDSIFLCEVFSYEILDYKDVYYYDGKFFGKLGSFSDKEIIYKNVDKIINDGIKVC